MPTFPFTPSHLPHFAGQAQVRKLEKALKEGADPNGVDLTGQTALHTVLGTKPGQTVRMIQMLVNAGADVNAVSEKGETPLTCALQRGCDLEHITALLDAGADLGKMNADGSSPLTKAFHQNQRAAFDLMLARGAPWDARKPMEWTTLHYAAASTVHDHYTRALLNAGADPTVSDRFGRTAFDVARGPNVATLNAWRAKREKTELDGTLAELAEAPLPTHGRPRRL